MKYQYIKRRSQHHSVSRLCALLSVSRSGYYEWLGRTPSARAVEDKRLLHKIEGIHAKSRESYGAMKTWQALRAEGEGCGHNRVARIRRDAGIEAKRKQRFRRSEAARNNEPSAPNLLQRNFRVEQPNQVWVSDTTFISTRYGWLYLAVVIDLYSRRVVGWSMNQRNDQKLVCDALQMAVKWRKPPAGMIHHSDQGIQYACSAYRELLDVHGIIRSMSRKGNCLDNAVAESFFSNLKNELVHHCNFEDRTQARSAIFDYIEVFYNRQRIHQTIGYHSPEEYEVVNVA